MMKTDYYNKLVERNTKSKAGKYGNQARGGNNVPQSLTANKGRNRSIRDTGGGVKWDWTSHEIKLKSWLNKERCRGHVVDRADIQDEWSDMIAEEITALKAVTKLTSKQEQIYSVLSAKLESWMLNTEVTNSRNIDTMLTHMGARLGTPQRSVNLTAAEEKHRCELTWKQNDDRLWIAAFATGPELRNWVSDPKEFVRRRAETWLVYSDQIPFWIQIGLLKTVFADWETRKSESKEILQLKKKARLTKSQESQKLGVDVGIDGMAAAETAPTTDDNEGMTQKRGPDRGGEKVRVTFEARQAVTGLFGTGEVKGHILHSLLVVRGQYARLDNIDADHTWKKDETIQIGDEIIVRKAGEKNKRHTTTLLLAFIPPLSPTDLHFINPPLP